MVCDFKVSYKYIYFCRSVVEFVVARAGAIGQHRLCVVSSVWEDNHQCTWCLHGECDNTTHEAMSRVSHQCTWYLHGE